MRDKRTPKDVCGEASSNSANDLLFPFFLFFSFFCLVLLFFVFVFVFKYIPK